MDINIALLILFRRITDNHSLPQSEQLTQATDIQEEEIKVIITYRTLKVPVKNYGSFSDLHK